MASTHAAVRQVLVEVAYQALRQGVDIFWQHSSMPLPAQSTQFNALKANTSN